LVQSDILKPHPTAHLRVYAIWTNKLFGDARNRWDAAGLTDPRVMHLWDANDTSGDWLVDHVSGYQAATGTPPCCSARRHLDQPTDAAAQLGRPGRQPDRRAQPSRQPTTGRHHKPVSHHTTSRRVP
jgi:hypothetical protein